MTDEQTAIAKAGAWYGVIAEGAAAHETTAQIWQRIHDYSQHPPGLPEGTVLSEPPELWQAVNQMRGIASGLQYAQEAFGKAPDSYAIEPSMIAPTIYQRSSADLQQLASKYHVRFSLTTVGALGATSNWYNLPYDGSLPATVGELRDSVDILAQTLTDVYGLGSFVSVDAIQIGAY